MNKFTLWFNAAGSWRKVLNFDHYQMEDIQKASVTLLQITHNTKGRITGPDGAVLYYAAPYLWQWAPA